MPTAPTQVRRSAINQADALDQADAPAQDDALDQADAPAQADALAQADAPTQDVLPYCWIDGHIVETSQVAIGLAAPGLHYASSVFDGIRVYHGQPYQLAAHLDRFRQSAELLGLEVPWSDAELSQAVAEFCVKNILENGYLRPIAWTEGTTLGLAAAGASTRVAITGLISASTLDQPIQRLSLHLSTWQRPCFPAALDLAKSSSHYALGGVALAAARSAGYDDALLLDSAGNLCETATANVFIRSDNLLSTPSARPALAGITRARLLYLAVQSGYRVEEKRLNLDDALIADEIFICGTYLEIASVRQIATSAGVTQFQSVKAATALQAALAHETGVAAHG